MKTYVIADIHGANKALEQVLERSHFNKEEDTLITLGDYADGWSEVDKVVDTLLTVKNLIPIKGNHDEWFITWVNTGVHPAGWHQGGDGTLNAYCNRLGRTMWSDDRDYITDLDPLQIPAEHAKFWRGLHNYYFDKEKNRVFVHGGYSSPDGIGHDDEENYYWDRELWQIALSGAAMLRSSRTLEHRLPRRLRPHNEIFIGHTTTMMWDTDLPMPACNVWNLDTGAGFKGKLTIMDVDTKEYWQSDAVNELYINETGRN